MKKYTVCYNDGHGFFDHREFGEVESEFEFTAFRKDIMQDGFEVKMNRRTRWIAPSAILWIEEA